MSLFKKLKNTVKEAFGLTANSVAEEKTWFLDGAHRSGASAVIRDGREFTEAEWAEHQRQEREAAIAASVASMCEGTSEKMTVGRPLRLRVG